MNEQTTFVGKNYVILLDEDYTFVLVHPVGEDERFTTFDELVEAHPTCEEARSFFWPDTNA